MRVGTENFEVNNSSLSKVPRYVVVQAYDDEATDLIYFTSHPSCETPVGVVVISSVIEGLSVTSQSMRPEKAQASIGKASYTLVDKDNQIRTLHATKLASGKSLKSKRTAFYMGYEGDSWDDYQLVQTQIVDEVNYTDTKYVHNCSDVQRLERKDIFILSRTTLAASLLIDETTIQVYDTSVFEMVAHGSSYSDAPNTTVGYVKIADEVIRYTGKTSTTFTGCVRGSLGTKEVDHVINLLASADRRTEVKEHIYLEMPIAKLMYALLTGSLYNQASSLPNNWHLNIDTTFIKTSDFINIGVDFWNTNDDEVGLITRFEGLSKTDGKKFIEKELNLLVACFNPIYTDGSLGLKRAVHIISDSAPSIILDESNIVSFGNLTHDMLSVKNDLAIQWNYDSVKETYTRKHVLYDSNSITTYGQSKQLVLKFRGLHGSIHTIKTIEKVFDRLRDRFVSPPLHLTVKTLFSKNAIEVGDVVRVKLEALQDYNTDTTLDRSFEVQKVSVDWVNGTVNLSLFGSAAKAGTIERSGTSTVLPDSWYTSEGINIAGLAGVIAGHVTSDLVLTGNDDLTNSLAVYYFDGSLIVDDDVKLTVTNNVQLRVRDFIVVDGTLTGKGQGIAGKAAATTWDSFTGVEGYIGSTSSQASYTLHHSNNYVNTLSFTLPAIGQVSSIPEYNIFYNIETEKLEGLPTDLRSSSGGCGGQIVQSAVSKALGGKGGDGSAGLAIICRGITTGANGLIDQSGIDGELGEVYAKGGSNHHAGTGAGSAPSGLLVLLDGSSATYTADFKAEQGRTEAIGEAIAPIRLGWQSYESGKEYSSASLGIDNGDRSQSSLRVQYIPKLVDAVIDVPEVAEDALSLSIVEYKDTPHSAAGNLSSLEVTVNPPSDANYDYSNIYYKVDTQDVWTFAGVANDERVISVASDGLTYDIKAHSVSIWGVESNSSVIGQITTTDVTTPELNTDIAVIETLVVPDVTGLEIFEGGNI